MMVVLRRKGNQTITMKAIVFSVWHHNCRNSAYNCHEGGEELAP